MRRLGIVLCAALAACAGNPAPERTSDESPRIVYRPGSGSIPTVGIVESVVVAADNEWDIVVISAGETDSVRIGHVFTVYRGNEYVSTIVVDQLFPNHAACRTKPGHKRLDVQRGDEVSNRL